VNESHTRHRALHPAKILARRSELLFESRRRFERGMQDALKYRVDRLSGLQGLLRTLGPESAFQRGFSITLGENGKLIRLAKSLNPGDIIRTKFSDGECVSVVKDDHE
jgi:exodeoxyribonuclease VII large subunit